ncbi:DUF397 domain-containing protein [Nocardiopsis sediminis]|uniref:DUF397 domain-containing protein n=1 Tax=Nocardiopsis sediminis TaxID=1778267 RepID=A0ABV8FJK7_9ACTN
MNQRKWHKSSYSGGSSGHCVEVSEGPETLIRDTKHRDAATLSLGAREWVALLADIDAL